MEQTIQNLPVTVMVEPEYQALAVAPQAQSIYADMTAFEGAQRVAKMLSASSLVPQQFQNNVPNTMIALEMAMRTGVSPFMLMQNLYVVHGRPGFSATYIIAAISNCGRFSPLRFDLNGEGDNRGCVAWAIERATGDRLESTRVDIRMAKAEGWYGKSGSKWQTMPDQMLRYRAAAFFGRVYAPDILMGMQTSEELNDIGETTQPQRRNTGRRHSDATTTPPAKNNGPATVEEVNAMLNAADAKERKPAPAPPAAPAAPPVPPAPPAEEEPPHPAESAEAKPNTPEMNPETMNKVVQKYLRMLEEVRGMSAELPGWPERQTKMEAELGGKDSEYYQAVIEHWDGLMDELQAKMNGVPNGNGNGKRK